MNCIECARWLRESRTIYGDGTVIVGGRPQWCRALDRHTDPDFGCVKYAPAAPGDQIEETRKDGAPWQNWSMGPCPDCRGAGNAGDAACHRCTGTGNVRHYDDGYIGEERTRRHPNETAPPPVEDPGTVLAPVAKPDLL